MGRHVEPADDGYCLLEGICQSLFSQSIPLPKLGEKATIKLFGLGRSSLCHVRQGAVLLANQHATRRDPTSASWSSGFSQVW